MHSFPTVPITQTWREELKRLTDATGLKTKSQYTNTTAFQLPPSRQGSRHADRPPPSRGGEIPPSRNGEKAPSRLDSRMAERPSMSRHGARFDERPLQHIAPYPDGESMVRLFKTQRYQP